MISKHQFEHLVMISFYFDHDAKLEGSKAVV